MFEVCCCVSQCVFAGLSICICWCCVAGRRRYYDLEAYERREALKAAQERGGKGSKERKRTAADDEAEMKRRRMEERQKVGSALLAACTVAHVGAWHQGLHAWCGRAAVRQWREMLAADT